MKQTALILLIAVLASCASVPPPVTDQEFEARAQAAIGTLVEPAPVELTLLPDYLLERVTVLQSKTIKQQPNAPKQVVNNDPQPIGISLGNGLYLDSLLNLGIRVDLLAGVGTDFRGTTNFWRSRPGSVFFTQADYSDDSITVEDRTAAFGGKYRVDLKADGQGLNGLWLSHKKDSYEILSTTPSKLTVTDNGIQRSWTEGLEFRLDGPRTMDFSLRPGTVFERSHNKLLVQSRNLYVHVRYDFPENESAGNFRIYRSADGLAVIDEDNGKLIVFKKTDTGVDWQNVGAAPVPPFRAEGRITVRPAS